MLEIKKDPTVVVKHEIEFLKFSSVIYFVQLETIDTRKVRVVRLGVDDRFVTHGSTAELMHMLGLDADGIAESLIKLRVEC